MSEEFRINGPFGNGTAINRNVLPMLASAVLMDNLRKAFLTHTALAGNQHGQVSRRHLNGHINGARQPRIIAYDAKPQLDLLYFCFCHDDYNSSSALSSFSLSLSSRFS